MALFRDHPAIPKMHKLLTSGQESKYNKQNVSNRTIMGGMSYKQAR